MKMVKFEEPSQQKSSVKVIKWTSTIPLSQEEAEARLHQESYRSICWYDVPGTTYPKHSHAYDECLWIIKGELFITIGETTYHLTQGDRLYLPARITHKVNVPLKSSVTFLVGQKEISS